MQTGEGGAEALPLNLLTPEQLATLHRMGNKYLVTSVEKNKSDINGSEYATLIDQLHFAKRNGMLGLY